MADAVTRTGGLELHFVSDDVQARELCRLYWEVDGSGEFVHAPQQLAEAGGLQVSRLAAFVRRHCVAYDADYRCHTCDGPSMVVAYKSRTEYFSALRRRPHAPRNAICPSCRKREAEAAALMQDRLAAERRSAIHAENERRARELQLDQQTIRRLSATELLFLLAVIRAGASDDLAYIVPHSFFARPLSPRPEFDTQILGALYHRGLLWLHPGSRNGHITVARGVVTSFSMSEVHWLLPLDVSVPRTAFVEKLTALVRAETFRRDHFEELNDLRRRLALEECLQRVSVAAQQHSMTPEFVDASTAVLEELLRRLSVRHAFDLIASAVRDAAVYQRRSRIADQQAASYFARCLQRAGREPQPARRSTDSGQRDRRRPPDALSELLTTVLGLPDGSLNSLPMTSHVPLARSG